MSDGGDRIQRTRRANGESSVYQDGAGRWHGWVTLGLRPDGSPDRRHRTAKTRKDVVAKIKELERARDRGVTAANATGQTLKQWLDHWITNIAPARLRRKSLAAYTTDVRHLQDGLGQHRLQRLTQAHVEAFYAAMARETKVLADGRVVRRYRPATIDHVHRTLRRALGDAARAGLVGHNAASGAQRPTSQAVEDDDHLIEPLDVPAARAIIDAALRRRNGVRYVLALSHGLRQGEALGLAISHLHLDAEVPFVTIRQQLQRHTWIHGCADRTVDGSWPCGNRRGADCPARHGGGLVLTQIKSKSGRRDLALDPVSVDLLRRHLDERAREKRTAANWWEESDLLFTQPNGRPIDPRRDLLDWHHLLDEVGVPHARLHDARHTAATMLLVQGVDPRVVMDIMGWSSAAMLGRYQHVVSSLRLEAALRMAALLHPSADGDADGGNDD